MQPVQEKPAALNGFGKTETEAAGGVGTAEGRNGQINVRTEEECIMCGRGQMMDARCVKIPGHDERTL